MEVALRWSEPSSGIFGFKTDTYKKIGISRKYIAILTNFLDFSLLINFFLWKNQIFRKDFEIFVKKSEKKHWSLEKLLFWISWDLGPPSKPDPLNLSPCISMIIKVLLYYSQAITSFSREIFLKNFIINFLIKIWL